MTSSDRLYAHALKDLGLAETAGSASTARIKLAISFAADWLDKDDSKTAWCGCIRGLWGTETQTGTPAAYYRAVNWSRWGKRVANISLAKQGDTVILERKGGFHVGLFHSLVNDNTFKLLGGNQSDKCSIAPQQTSLIYAIRRGSLDP